MRVSQAEFVAANATAGATTEINATQSPQGIRRIAARACLNTATTEYPPRFRRRPRRRPRIRRKIEDEDESDDEEEGQSLIIEKDLRVTEVI